MDEKTMDHANSHANDRRRIGIKTLFTEQEPADLWRGDVRAGFVEGEHATLGYTSEDLPGADPRVPLSILRMGDLRTGPVERRRTPLLS